VSIRPSLNTVLRLISLIISTPTLARLNVECNFLAGAGSTLRLVRSFFVFFVLLVSSGRLHFSLDTRRSSSHGETRETIRVIDGQELIDDFQFSGVSIYVFYSALN
jgi:hypothetical protein